LFFASLALISYNLKAYISLLHNMPQLRWFVTGCSSGLGETFVRSILARGDKVVATARGDPERLSSLKEAGAETHSLDVTASLAEIKAVVAKVLEGGPIDVLVNNAGYVEAGVAEEVRYVPSTVINSRAKTDRIIATRTT
jgi:NAD(P)-dependent dehydrogenase (short-subunit alcohol dehydrogenase family)